MLHQSVIFILQNSGRRAWSQHLHQLPCKVALQNSSSIPSVLKTSRSWAVPHIVPVTVHVVQVRWTEKINYAPVRSYDWLAYDEVARNHMAYKPCQIFQRRTVQKELGEPLRFIKRVMYKKQVDRRAANSSRDRCLCHARWNGRMVVTQLTVLAGAIWRHRWIVD